MASEAGPGPAPGRAVTWISRIRGWLAPALPPELESAFRDDAAQANCRRLLILAPLVLVGHAIHVAVFHTTAETRAAMGPALARWRDGVASVHAATFVVTLTLAIAMLRFRRTRAARVLGPAAALTYFLHGAAIAGVDQLSIMGANGVAPFIGYCLFMSVIVTLPPRTALILYATAAAVFWAALSELQPSREVRLALMPNGLSIAMVSLTLSLAFYSARRRAFVQSRTIAQQQESLAALNADLERRVASQVSSLVERAEEVERLNAQLQAQVRARSTELSTALARLARRSESETLRPGLVLGDRFEVGKRLGQGGMGVVHAGVDRTTGEQVAIKIVQASSTRQLDALHRFLREARATATVSHPAIVRALFVDVTADGMLYQVHEFVAGVTLHQRFVEDARPWEPGLAARACSVLCDALAAAHEGGVVHRDVKPSNVMLTPGEPGLKLLDFGIAKLYADADARARDGEGFTGSGVILGTPAFMSPEQLDGWRDVGAPTDVYAAGIVLFLLLTARLPFDERSGYSVAASHLFATAPDVRSFVEVSEPLASLVARCLKKEPEARPSASELRDALRAIADAAGAPPLTAAARPPPERAVPADLHVAETVVSGRR